MSELQERDNRLQLVSLTELPLSPRISIIVAAFNEEASIEACVRRIAAVFPDGEAEIVVADGGHDRTRTIVESLTDELTGLRYVRVENDRGKGHAIRTGIDAARGALQAQIDADLQFLPEELPRLFAPLERDEADLVLGSRFVAGLKSDDAALLRTFGNRITSAYASLLFRHPMTDVLAGMKAWRRDLIRKIPLTSDGFAYEVEIPAGALLLGARVVDVPVSTKAREAGESHVDVVRDGLSILRELTRFRLR